MAKHEQKSETKGEDIQVEMVEAVPEAKVEPKAAPPAETSPGFLPAPPAEREIPPGLMVFWALQQHEHIAPEDRLDPSTAASIAFYATKCDDCADAMTATEARAWVKLFSRQYPPAWGALRQGDMPRFSRTMDAYGKPTPTVAEFQLGVTLILQAAVVRADSAA